MSHQKKKILQTGAPVLATGVMLLITMLNQYFPILWDYLMILSLSILWATYLPSLQLPSEHVQLIKFSCIFFLGLIHQGIVEALLQVTLPSTSSIYYTLSLPITILLAHLIILSAKMVGDAQRKGYDPMICYTHWPKSPLWRLFSLVHYYASSNGLFMLTYTSTATLLIQTTSIKSLLLSLDLFIYMIFIGFIVSLITLITRIDLLTRIVARYPGISLLTFFVLLFKSFYLISGYHYSSLTIDMCRLNIAQHFIFLTPPNTFNLKTGLSLLLVPLFGNLVYKLQATHYLYTLGLFLGIVTKTHLPFHNNSLVFIIYGIFVVMMILNIYLAKTPLHAFDTPFLKTQRCPLKPSRWLKKLSYAFSTILCMQVICPPIYTFILLQNFGLLILIGICYCSFIKLTEYFFVYLRGFFNILQLKRANALSS